MKHMNDTGDKHSFGDTPEDEPETNEDGTVEPSEDEQLDYDMIVTRALKQIHGSGMDNILKTLGSAERPSQGMGQVTARLIETLKQSAKEGGREIADNTLQHAGVEIIQELSELAVAKGVFEYADEAEEDQEIQDAGLWAVKYYGEAQKNAGAITPEMTGQAQQDMQQGIEAEQQSMAQPAGGGIVSGEIKDKEAM